MDDDVRSRVFDPSASSALALAHRPADCPPVVAVVSGLVRSEVIALLRWTAAGTGDCAALDAGRWWRLATGCADLLRRLPALCDELGERWELPPAPEDDEHTGAVRAERTAARLLELLSSGRPVPLGVLAGEVDALGAAALGVLAASASDDLTRSRP